MESQTPIQIHIPPPLSHLAIPLPTFLSRNNNQYTNLVVSSFIFLPSQPAGLRLLLVQRAARERSFPNQWEIPGGSCDASDPTVLHSLARETFEETGLRLTRFKRQVGTGINFVTGYGARQKRWLKLSFEIDVAEITEGGGPSSNDKAEGQKRDEVGPAKDIGEGGGAGGGVGGGETDPVRVTLDPEEHQAYAWATEEEIAQGKYRTVSVESKDLMLEAFALRKAD